MIGEWALYRKGELDLAERRSWGGNGTWLRYHGEAERPLQCALTLVTAPDHAVSVLALGAHRQMLALHDLWLEGQAELSRRTYPPVTILLHGEPWTFHGARGLGLLGVAQARGSVVLLGHDGERVRFLHGDGGDFTTVMALRLSDLPEKLDLDAHVISTARVRPPKRSPPVKDRGAARRRLLHRLPPAGVAGAIRQHHRRILQGVELGEEEGEAVRLVVRIALEGIARAAETVERPPTRKGNVKARRAVDCVRPILDVLYRMGEDHRGSGRAIFRRFREFDRVVISMTADDFVSALGLLVDTGTCLASRPSFQVWLLRGDGIANPHARLHRELCEETRTAAGRPRGRGRAGPERAGTEPAVPESAGPMPQPESAGPQRAGPQRAGPESSGSQPGSAGSESRSAGPESAGPGPAGPQPEPAPPERGADAPPPFDQVLLHLHPEERLVAVVVGRILGDSILEGGEGTASTDAGEEREAGGPAGITGECELAEARAAGGPGDEPDVAQPRIEARASPVIASTSAADASTTAAPLAVLVDRALLCAGLVTDEEVARFPEHHWSRSADREHQAELADEVASEPGHAEPSPTPPTPLLVDVAADPADAAPPPTLTGQRDSGPPMGDRYDPRRGPRRRITGDVASPGSRMSADRCASA